MFRTPLARVVWARAHETLRIYGDTHKSDFESVFKHECSERTFGQWNISVYNVSLTEPEVRPVLFLTSVLRTQKNLQVKPARNVIARYWIFFPLQAGSV